MPKVSVIIPTYNRAKLIDRAISSVLTQTFTDFEIIVIDDASSDNTKEIVHSFNDPQIRYISHKENKGGAAARNTGILASKGEYIAFLDSDDEWLPEKLEKQIEIFKNSPKDVGIVYSGLYVISKGKIIREDVPFKRGNIYRDQLFEDYVAATSTIMVRKECLDKIGGFDEKLPARQDYDLSLRLSKYYEFEFTKQPMVKVYWDSNNRVTNSQNRRIAGQMIINKIAKEIRYESKYTQRSILAHQYFTLGAFCYYSGEKKSGINYLLRSLKLNPFGLLLWRFWRLFFIFVLGYRTYIFLSRPLAHGKKFFKSIKK